MKRKELEKSALKAVKLLRKKKFQQGLPFMINSDMLDSDQCFLEYPNGMIKVVEANSRERDFEVVFEFTLRDSNDLRKKLNLI